MFDLLSLPRLPVARQRNVTRELAEALAGKARKNAPAGLLPLADAVLAAGEGLAATGENSAFAIDVATDRVVAGIYAVARAWAKGLPDGVVALSPEQRRLRAAAQTILREAFARGTGFIHRPMDLEYDALVALVEALERPAVAAAVKTLALGPMVDHLRAHLAPYGFAVKNPAGEDLGAASARWHAAFRTLAGAVPAHDDATGSWSKTLLGAYQRELKAHQDDAARQRRAAKKPSPKP